MGRTRTARAKAADGNWSTGLTSIEPNRILLRGYPLDDLMGRLPFGESVYLLLTGELPSPSIGRIIEAMLVSFVDHGATPPSTLAARNAATTGASLRSSVAAGVLGFGPHHGGDALACRQMLDGGLACAKPRTTISRVAEQIVNQLVEAGDLPPPGFGHRFHTIDPRAVRLMQISHELEIDDLYTRLIRAIEQALAAHPALEDRPLPINVDGAIAAVCGDVGLAPELADALLIISRVPGLAAHALEEQTREAPMRAIDPTAHAYDGPRVRRLPERYK